MQRNGLMLQQAESVALLASVEDFLLHYHWLTQNALSSGRLLYNYVVKFHFLWHIADNAKWLNPRATWAYSYENFIGKRGLATRSLVHSTVPVRVPAKLVENYLRALYLRLRRTRNPAPQ